MPRASIARFWSGTMLVAMSTPPAINSAARVLLSGTTRKTARWKGTGRAVNWSFRTSTTRSSLTQRSSL